MNITNRLLTILILQMPLAMTFGSGYAVAHCEFQINNMCTSANVSHEWGAQLFEFVSNNTIGLQFQNDNIYNGLYNTKARQSLSSTRRDHLVETSVETVTNQNPLVLCSTHRGATI